MHIDEFLDREAEDLGVKDMDLGSDPFGGEVSEEGHDLGDPFEDLKSHLSQGNLEKAEKSYHKLWSSLTKKNLDWDKDLFEKIYLISKEFLTVLHNSYQQLKTKENEIYALITKGRQLLKAGNKDEAFKIQKQIEDTAKGIPNVFFEENNNLQKHIDQFKKELKSETDQELMKRVLSIVGQTNQLLEKITTAIKSKNVEAASKDYLKCIELYDQIPEGFIRQKASIGMQIVQIYRHLSIYYQIHHLQKQLVPDKTKPSK